MQRKNIPVYVLSKGISQDGFEKLLTDIKSAVIVDGVNKFNEYTEMIEFVKCNSSDESIDQWISDFMVQLEESNKIINENVHKIEELFNRIFNDWKKYKSEHDVALESVEKKEEDANLSELAKGDRYE